MTDWPKWIRSWPCIDNNCDGNGTVCLGAHYHGDGDIEFDIHQCQFCTEREELAKLVETQTTEISELQADAAIFDDKLTEVARIRLDLESENLRLRAEITRMDKRTKHLLNRIEDAELALRVWDESQTSEYWERYPKSERGLFFPSTSDEQHEKAHGAEGSCPDDAPAFDDSSQEFDEINPNAIVAALTWNNVAEHMRGNGYDPDDCVLSDVMLSVRKIARAASVDSRPKRTCEPHGRFPCRKCGTKHFDGCQCSYCAPVEKEQ